MPTGSLRAAFDAAVTQTVAAEVQDLSKPDSADLTQLTGSYGSSVAHAGYASPAESSSVKLTPSEHPLNQLFIPPNHLSRLGATSSPNIQLGRKFRSSSEQHQLAVIPITAHPVNEVWSFDTQRMPPPPISKITDPNGSRSGTVLGKRKESSTQALSVSTHSEESGDMTFIQPSLRQTRGISIISMRNPAEPIPILPTPIPSRRFKKHQTSRQVLIPVEQLPVFALPPLPVIPDAKLLKQVFTHQSLFEYGRGKFEETENQPAEHYEKLEHVGDSILGVAVTTWLHEIRPNLTCGTATVRLGVTTSSCV